MISVLISRLVLLVFGTLYPAYASYKTVKTKNVREYVRWMMYWIVFAAYTLIEIFTDIFFAFWFPFYYELKIVFVLWLVCPATRGSTYIFKKVINPQLSKHEVVIDSYINALWNRGYDLVRQIGAQGMDYLVEIILDLLRKGQITIANFMPHVNEISQTVTDSQIAVIAKESTSDVNALDDDFIIMTDYSETDEVIAPKSSKVSQSANESESEDVIESHAKMVVTRSKRKVGAVRERRKNDKK